MNNREIREQYKNMINSKYWGITIRMNDLISDLVDQSPIHKQIGSNLQKDTLIHNSIEYIIIHNKEYNDFNFHLVTIKDSVQFGIILFQRDNKDIAMFQDAFAYGGANVSQIEFTNDTILITKLMIKICKKMNIKKILVEDNLFLKIFKPNTSEFYKFVSGYELELNKFYTMINGKPWYSQFGFINSKKNDQNNINHNYKKLLNKKVKDYPKNIFIEKEFIDLYDKHKESDIKEFINLLKIHNVEMFNRIDHILYENLELKDIRNKHYYLVLVY